MKKDPLFLIFIVASFCFYLILAAIGVLAFFITPESTDVIRNMIRGIDINTMSHYYMVLGLSYIAANLGEKFFALTDFKLDENGKLTNDEKRKLKLWAMSFIYFLMNIALFFILNFKGIENKLDPVGFLLNFVIISLFVMGANTTQSWVAMLPSPIEKLMTPPDKEDKQNE